MRNYVFLGILLFTQAFATTFTPVSIRDQIKEAQGLVQGEVVALNSERDPSLGIVTRVFLRADRWMGADVNDNHIELYYPGGELEGEGRSIHGAPKFSIGERVVVLTQFHEGKSWVQNLGLGKFSIKKVGRTEIVVNQIFPNVPDVGQMPLRAFLGLAKDLKDKKFHERFLDKYERSASQEVGILRGEQTIKRSGRSIASTNNESEPGQKPSPFWLVLLLGVLGSAFRLGKARKGQ